ncbi:hypothetical protein BU16DRAFT_525551 [Lophium mytilinum]|uniref:Uncharacterized protein n=1 Tax=Lophium mytilinum TaxID=390894 RepID=A0A6A6R175_9PEZI|nr:hypothetical protein BU16DRAFT_525551 [Lophium mytilinum]
MLLLLQHLFRQALNPQLRFQQFTIFPWTKITQPPISLPKPIPMKPPHNHFFTTPAPHRHVTLLPNPPPSSS